VKGLMQAAGGRKLLDRWRDRALMDLNVDINNAVTHYQAFYMVRNIDEPDSRAALTRQAAEAELNGAQRRYNEARGSYRGLR
jgi:DNA uptake protein ComE-like DNA-binding protein